MTHGSGATTRWLRVRFKVSPNVPDDVLWQWVSAVGFKKEMTKRRHLVRVYPHVMDDVYRGI